MAERLPEQSEHEPTPEQQLERAERIIRELLLTVGDPDYELSDQSINDAYAFVLDRDQKNER